MAGQLILRDTMTLPPLYIMIRDGQPHLHPHFHDNFMALYPDFDGTNLPEGWARFERISQPELGPYEVLEDTVYEWDGDIVKDVHHVRAMTEEEKTAKQDLVHQSWNNYFPSWTFDEALCQYVAPTPCPQDGKQYGWVEDQLTWVEIPLTE